MVYTAFMPRPRRLLTAMQRMELFILVVDGEYPIDLASRITGASYHEALLYFQIRKRVKSYKPVCWSQRRCRKCKRVHPVEHYPPAPSLRGGKSYTCMSCRAYPPAPSSTTYERQQPMSEDDV